MYYGLHIIDTLLIKICMAALNNLSKFIEISINNSYRYSYFVIIETNFRICW